jgi:hypothetical protein
MKTLKHYLLNLSIVYLIFLNCQLGFSQDKPVATTSSTPVSTNTFASKGVFEIGGSASYSSITIVSDGQSQGGTVSIFNLSPELGYFVTNGLELGFNTGVSFIPYGFANGITSFNLGDDIKSTIIELFATVAYNFRTKGESVYPYIEGQIGYSTESQTLVPTASGLSYGFRGGIKVIATSHLLFTFSAQYLAVTLDQPSDTQRNGFNYLSVGVGVGGFF